MSQRIRQTIKRKIRTSKFFADTDRYARLSTVWHNLKKRKAEKPLVTVIMPFYNNENTLNAALKSVKRCGYGNYEIIVINDGSGQNPKEIISRYRKVKYVYKENGGLGSARNRGIEEAAGKYVIFLDSDDTLYPGGLNALVDIAESENLQLAAGRTRRVEADSGKYKYWRKEIYSETYVNNMSERHRLLADTLSTAKIYRADLFEEGRHRFDKGLFEDIPFIADMYSEVDRIGVVVNTVQNWMVYGVDTSITTRLTKENVMDRLKRLDQVFERQKEEFRYCYTVQFVNNQIVYCINGFRRLCEADRKEIYQRIKKCLEMRQQYISKDMFKDEDRRSLTQLMLDDDYDGFEKKALEFSDIYFEVREKTNEG